MPEEPGCYAIANLSRDVLYIGQTGSLHRRMQEHCIDERMTGPTAGGLANWFYFSIYAVEEIDRIETELLFNFKLVEGTLPLLNRIGP